MMDSAVDMGEGHDFVIDDLCLRSQTLKLQVPSSSTSDEGPQEAEERKSTPIPIVEENAVQSSCGPSATLIR